MDNPPDSTPPTENAPAPAPVDMKAVAQQSEEVLGTMLRLLMFEVKLQSTVEDQSIRINLECEDPGRLIGRRGMTVNQLQYLLNRVLQRKHPSLPRIYLDVAGHEEQEKEKEKEKDEKISDEFTRRITSAGDQVRRWGQAVDLGSLKPTEQKAVRDLFGNDRELEIFSLDPNADPEKPQRLQLRIKEK
jgi:spoIIIJ-associated protein